MAAVACFIAVMVAMYVATVVNYKYTLRYYVHAIIATEITRRLICVYTYVMVLPDVAIRTSKA